jgi:hypothetical protein
MINVKWFRLIFFFHATIARACKHSVWYVYTSIFVQQARRLTTAWHPIWCWPINRFPLDRPNEVIFKRDTGVQSILNFCDRMCTPRAFESALPRSFRCFSFPTGLPNYDLPWLHLHGLSRQCPIAPSEVQVCARLCILCYIVLKPC